MSDNPISLKQAVYRSGLATSLFELIFERAKYEYSIELNNLIALANEINQEVQLTLLKYSPTPLIQRLLSHITHRRPLPLTQLMFLTEAGCSLYEVILDQCNSPYHQSCPFEIHAMLGVTCDINQEVYHALRAVVYDE